jgi:glycosyltransferase involved in cell wall biosynthesis
MLDQDNLSDSFLKIEKPRILIFIVAYKAESHIESVLDRIPSDIWESNKFDTEILVVDDASGDETAKRATQHMKENYRNNMVVLENQTNQGYGGNQKIGYNYAIKNNFDIVVLLHGDGQYAPEYLHDMVDPLVDRQVDAVFGSRMLKRKDALKGGMPLYKYAGNKILTKIQNLILGTRLSEFHSGYRAYRVETLKSIPLQYNSNDFDFDTDIIIQLVDNKLSIAEVPIPTFYGNEICYVNGIKYAINIVITTILSRLQLFGITYNLKFDYSGFKFGK